MHLLATFTTHAQHFAVQRANSCESNQSKRNHRLEKTLWAEIIFHCYKRHRRLQQLKESRIKMELACLPCQFCQNILTTLRMQSASLFCYQKFRSFHLSLHVIEQNQESKSLSACARNTKAGTKTENYARLLLK